MQWGVVGSQYETKRTPTRVKREQGGVVAYRRRKRTPPLAFGATGGYCSQYLRLALEAREGLVVVAQGWPLLAVVVAQR
jgi:hypothetical protein